MSESPLLVCGEALAWLRAQPAQSIDAIITDPPYGLGHVYGGTKEEHTSALTYGPWIRTVFAECRRVIRPKGTIVIRQARIYWWHLHHWFPHADLQMLVKLNPWNGGFDVTHAYDPLIVWRDYRQFPRQRRPQVPTPAQRTDVVFADCREPIRTTARGQHPHPFYLDAALTLVDRYTEPGQLVVDPFMGSGTIVLAAHHRGRRAIGVEREQVYVDLAQQVLTKGVIDERNEPRPRLENVHPESGRPRHQAQPRAGSSVGPRRPTHSTSARRPHLLRRGAATSRTRPVRLDQAAAAAIDEPRITIPRRPSPRSMGLHRLG